MEPNFEFLNKAAEMMKAIAHPIRLCIVAGLAEKKECNVSSMQHCIKSPQSTISQHLQKLRTAGVISARRQGLEVYYRIEDKRVLKILKILNSSR